MKVNKAYLGLGTNIGDREKNLKIALEEISKTANITKKSSIHETKPEGVKDQGDFLNMAIEIETTMPPTDLFKRLQKIEKTMGRVKTIKNGPRIIDIDILLYEDLKINEPELVIPHPRMHERQFVLKPLSEIKDE